VQLLQTEASFIRPVCNMLQKHVYVPITANKPITLSLVLTSSTESRVSILGQIEKAINHPKSSKQELGRGLGENVLTKGKNSRVAGTSLDGELDIEANKRPHQQSSVESNRESDKYLDGESSNNSLEH
jgi:hypothetical protein